LPNLFRMERILGSRRLHVAWIDRRLFHTPNSQMMTKTVWAFWDDFCQDNRSALRWSSPRGFRWSIVLLVTWGPVSSHHGRRRKMPRKAVALTGRSNLVRTDIAHHRRKRGSGNSSASMGVVADRNGKWLPSRVHKIGCDRIHRLIGGLLANYNPGASRHPRRSNERAERQCLVMTDCATRIPSRRTHYLSPRLGSCRQWNT